MDSSKWEKLLKKYLFLYKDGVFELPYFSNSPQVMIDSLVTIPVIKNEIVKQEISSNNPFCKGTLKYNEIENGFWILTTQIDIKQNIVAKATYNEALRSSFYVLSFSVFEYELPFNNSLGKKSKIKSTCWTFYKPKTEVETYFYKNTKGTFYNFIFDKKWADENLFKNEGKSNDVLSKFLNNELGFFTILDVVPEAHVLSKQLSRNSKKNDNDVLKSISLKLMQSFFSATKDDFRFLENVSLKNIDYAKIAKAEHLILLHLNDPFLGVDKIAADVSMSPTKLKVDFKNVFGLSLLQYHKEKKLLIAFQILKNTHVPVSILSNYIGYESSSKFSAAFKKRFAQLPSECRNEY